MRSLLLVITALLLASLNTTAQPLPRLTSKITVDQILYFGIAKHLDDLDSIIVTPRSGSLELAHYSMDEVVETLTMDPHEVETFSRYLANYEAFMHQQPDPFIADTAIRSMLRYLRPWKGYQSSATPVVLELREGINITGLIMAAGETHLAFTPSASADTASVGVSRRQYRIVSFMDVNRIRLAEDPASAVDVQGTAPFLKRALDDLDVVTMYADVVPPEIEEDLHWILYPDGSSSVKGARGLQMPEEEFTNWIGMSVVAGAQWVLALPSSVTINQMSPRHTQQYASPSDAGGVNAAFSAAFVVPAIGFFDLGAEFTALIQPSTADEDNVVSGFDAYQLRLLGALHLLNPQQRPYRSVDLYVLAGIGMSYTVHRLQGRLAFGDIGQDFAITTNIWQPTARLGIGLAVALSRHFDIVMEGSGQYTTGGSYTSDAAAYRTLNSPDVGAFWVQSEDMSFSTAGVQIGLRYRIGVGK